MARKIYDIIPPKVAHKVEDAIKFLAVKDKKKGKTLKKAQPQKKIQQKTMEKRFPLREILIGGVVVFFLIGIYFFNKLPKVDIEISPKLDQITLEENILADASINAVDLQKKIIPLKLMEETMDSSQDFLATGIASNDGKAIGTITIFNKISPAKSLTLVSGTHFLSDSGKYFNTLSRVTIPAMKGKTPGSVSVKVAAKEVGFAHNIGPSNFSVPGLSGTAYYYGIWGESKEAMAGGYTGKVKKVTKDDLESAENVLTKTLLQNTQNSLKSKISKDEILLDGAMISKVIEVKSDVKADAIADKFNQSAKVKVSALVFKKQDLEQFTKDKISSQLSDGKILLESSLNLNYELKSVDFEKGIEKISLQSSVRSYYDVDFGGLSDLLKRKSSDEIKEVINLQYGENISEVKINFWPFWVKKSPKNQERININLNF